MNKTKKLGIVLNGGGGKGSYQIGIWKYMTEIGLDKFISVCSGSSVGALNAVLFANEDFDKALSIWLCNDLKEKILYHTTLMEKLIGRSLFTRDGLIEIINSVNLSNISKTVYATCSYFNPGLKNRKMQIEGLSLKKADALNNSSVLNCIISHLQGLFDITFCNRAIELNKLPVTEIICILLASTALPLIFPKERALGFNFYDGGLTDNSPVYPLIQSEHCSDIIVLHLNEQTQEATYDMSCIHDIFPTRNLGSFTSGTLNFSRENAEQNIELGYNDAKNTYAQMLEELCEKYAA